MLTQQNYSSYLDEPEKSGLYRNTYCPCCGSSGAFDVGFSDVVCNLCDRIYYVREYNKYLDSMGIHDYEAM
jgi:hypothetical protein